MVMPTSHSIPRIRAFSAIDLWICAGAACQVAGWGFSAIGILQPAGYLAFLIVTGVVLFSWIRRKSCPENNLKAFITKFRWRVRHFLPVLFFIVAGLALIGGILYAPNNYDGLIYRIPRVLHWLEEHRWHWIHTTKGNLNSRSTGFEWMSAPVLAVLKTDRPLFLINWIPFILLPGLMFSVLRGFRVPARIAWNWMWLLPAGYCFALQAGSIANDMFAGIFALAAFHYALRFRRERLLRDFYFAWLAAALMTASKVPTVPLGIPLLILLYPGFAAAVRRPLSLLFVAVAVLSSLVPMAILNQVYCGDWTGAKAEDPWFLRIEPKYAFVATAVYLVEQNFAPPIFFRGEAVGEWVRKRFSQNFLTGMIRNNESREKIFNVSPFQNEEDAGLGIGLSCALILLIPVGILAKRHRRPLWDRTLWLVYGGMWVAILVYMARNAFSPIARYGAMYYLLLAVGPVWLSSAIRWRRWHWKLLAAATFGPVISLLILTRSRPLFPVEKTFQILQMVFPQSATLDKAKAGYAIYSLRSKGLSSLLSAIPEKERQIAFFSAGESPETSLWKPYGSRSLVHFKPGDSLDYFKSQSVHYLVINETGFESVFGVSPSDWTRTLAGTFIESRLIHLKASKEPDHWSVIRLSK